MTLTRRSLLVVGLAIPVAGTILRPALAREPEIYAPDGIALSGYDPVAYFTQGAAVKGRADHALIWRGATWYFASAQSQEAFEMNPLAYVPQYGGYCAYMMAEGSLASGAPEAFALADGRLYLAHTPEFLTLWKQDVAGNIREADAHWAAVMNKK